MVDASTVDGLEVAVEPLSVVLLDQFGVDLLVDVLSEAVHGAAPTNLLIIV